MSINSVSGGMCEVVYRGLSTVEWKCTVCKQYVTSFVPLGDLLAGFELECPTCGADSKVYVHTRFQLVYNTDAPTWKEE